MVLEVVVIFLFIAFEILISKPPLKANQNKIAHGKVIVECRAQFVVFVETECCVIVFMVSCVCVCVMYAYCTPGAYRQRIEMRIDELKWTAAKLDMLMMMAKWLTASNCFRILPSGIKEEHMIDRVAEFYITINYKCAIEEERIGCVGKK